MMSDHDESDGQFSFENDEIVWTHTPSSDTDFIVLRHPLLDAHSLPSTLSSDFTGHLSSDSDLSPALEKLSVQSSDVSSLDYHDGSCTLLASYEDASAFISRFISSPIRGNDAQLSLLRALIIELGIRSPNAPDLPSTLTSARKVLKAEVHVNIKEYATTRHKGLSALRDILKPSKSALRKDIRKGNGASLKWVKQQGLEVLLVTCFN